MKCAWEKITDFQDIYEFNRFVDWMNTQLNKGVAKEVPVKFPYAGATSLKEKWFIDIGSNDVWRLVWPDAPFTGVFEPVL